MIRALVLAVALALALTAPVSAQYSGRDAEGTDALRPASALTGAEVVRGVQNGQSVKITAQSIAGLGVIDNQVGVSGSTVVAGVPTRNPNGAYYMPRNSAIRIPSQLLAPTVMASPPTVVSASTSQFNASVTGTISGTVMTVSAVGSGVLNPQETCTGTSIPLGTVIISQATGSAGGTGTYNLSKSATVGSGETITCAAVQITNASNNSRKVANFVNDRFTYTRGGGINSLTLIPAQYYQYITCQSTTATYPSVTYACPTMAESFYHDGQYLEIEPHAAGCLLKVNDQYVSRTPSTGNDIFVNFGSMARRRIDVICQNPNFGVVNIGANDSLEAAPVRGPRVVILGDSFASGSLASFPIYLADVLGWDDVISSGAGGTGYVANNSGTNANYYQRVQHDVIAENPDIVWIEGSTNDWSLSNATLATNAALLYSTLRAALPNALIIASSTASGGVSTVPTSGLQDFATLKAAAAANGVLWLDLNHYPLQGTPQSGVIGGYGNYTAGTDGMSSGIGLSFTTGTCGAGSSCGLYTGMVIDIEPGTANEEEIEVRDWTVGSFSPPFYLVHFAGVLQHNHNLGVSYVQVGRSLWTGVGNNVTPTGYGNSDLYVGAGGGDTVHPSASGAAAVGAALATLLQLQTAAP